MLPSTHIAAVSLLPLSPPICCRCHCLAATTSYCHSQRRCSNSSLSLLTATVAAPPTTFVHRCHLQSLTPHQLQSLHPLPSPYTPVAFPHYATEGCSPSTITASSFVVVDSTSSSHACCLSPLAIIVLPQSCTTTTATAHGIVVLPCRNPCYCRLLLLPPWLLLQLHFASSAIAAGTPICRLQPHPTMPSFVVALPPTTALPLLPPTATHIPRLSLTITIATLAHHLIVATAINLKITAAPTHPLTTIAAINLHHLQSAFEAY
ncbi:hypothetical protein B296_00045895 [Ensete ventricosum]|uniref:Uncharacterized protein n=1 Tax=Ensete ventricosum TaxID=4639 RepID=A0A426XK11_ENSVE|nr:hypothetical protein B296_00045895 [Ensete ventricosum]